MPTTTVPLLLLLLLGWPLSAADLAAPPAAFSTVSIAPLPDAIAYEDGPIPLVWTLTNTGATAVCTDLLACDIDFDQMEVRFQELAAAGQAAIAFAAWEAHGLISGPRRAEPPLPPGAQFRHTLILNRYCTAIPPGTHRLQWTQTVPIITAGPDRRVGMVCTGTLTIQVLPGPHPHARELAAELFHAYQADTDARARRSAVRQLSYLRSPAATPYAAQILETEDADGQQAAADFLDRMRADGDARALLATVYLGRRSAARSAALSNLARRGELPDAATLHAMLTAGDHGLHWSALDHIARVASSKTVAERRALVAAKAVPLDDLLALLSSPSQSVRDQALAALDCFEVVVPLAR